MRSAAIKETQQKRFVRQPLSPLVRTDSVHGAAGKSYFFICVEHVLKVPGDKLVTM